MNEDSALEEETQTHFYGWLKTSFIEYTGKIATVVFTSGCNFRCPYCHNPELVLVDPELAKISPREVLQYLDLRRDLIDAVCITGGEPLLVVENFFPFLKEIKKRGKLVKIYTNGSVPEVFTKLNRSNLVDLWGIDFKLPFDQYHLVKGGEFSDACRHTLEEALKKPERAEVRTTLFPPFHNKEVLMNMARMLGNARSWFWQNFRKEHTLSEECRDIEPFLPSLLQSWRDEINSILGRKLIVLRS